MKAATKTAKAMKTTKAPMKSMKSMKAMKAGVWRTSRDRHENPEPGQFVRLSIFACAQCNFSRTLSRKFKEGEPHPPDRVNGSRCKRCTVPMTLLEDVSGVYWQPDNAPPINPFDQ